MPRKRYKPEEIIAKLRQVDVLVSQGQSMVEAIRQIGVSEVCQKTYFRSDHFNEGGSDPPLRAHNSQLDLMVPR